MPWTQNKNLIVYKKTQILTEGFIALCTDEYSSISSSVICSIIKLYTSRYASCSLVVDTHLETDSKDISEVNLISSHHTIMVVHDVSAQEITGNHNLVGVGLENKIYRMVKRKIVLKWVSSSFLV